MTRLPFTASFVIVVSLAVGAVSVLALCGDTWQTDSPDTVYQPTPGYGETYPINITKHWRIFWTDGYERRDAQARGAGQSYGWYTYTRVCSPGFDTPYWANNSNSTGDWVQRVHNKTVHIASDSCATGSPVFEDFYHRHTCNSTGGGGCNEVQSPTYGCASGFVSIGGTCTRSLAFQSQCDRFGGYDDFSCGCIGGCEPGGSCSPIVVDVLGNGFDLTNPANGVDFDVDSNGTAERRGWTARGTDDAWLALDRNRDGIIDSGKELFGNVTSQEPPSAGEEMNGFRALAMYDGPGYGGDGDGFITRHDAIFDRLKLWQDTNHNGVSETAELFSLPDLGLRKIDLNYRLSERVDAHGNHFKYRARVRDAQDAQLGRWAWDVFLVVQEP